MWRSHTTCLEVPLRQPLTACLHAQQLPGSLLGAAPGALQDGAAAEAPIALHLQLQASPDSPVTVRDIQLAPQLGLWAHPGYPLPQEWLLPLRLEPGGTAGVTFVLQRGRGERNGLLRACGCGPRCFSRGRARLKGSVGAVV
jgi:hypothetical protein